MARLDQGIGRCDLGMDYVAGAPAPRPGPVVTLQPQDNQLQRGVEGAWVSQCDRRPPAP